MSEGDRARDPDDHARDHPQKPFVRKRGYQYARNYPDPFTGELLQLYPTKKMDDFDSSDDYFVYLDALRRYTNFLPPKRPKPSGGA